MENLTTSNLIKIIEITTPVFTAIIGVFGGLMKNRFSYKYKNKERNNLVNILKEIDLLKIDNEFKDALIDEYKRLVIRDIKGIDITPNKYKAILDSGILNKYSNSQIKIANRFFEYPIKGLKVKIPWFDKATSIFYFVFAMTFITLGSALLVYTMNSVHDLVKYFVLAGFSLLTTAFGFFTISVFVAPVNVARMIKKDLDNIDLANKQKEEKNNVVTL